MLCIWLVSTTSTPKFFFEFYVLLQMHARGTLELEKSAMHHHNYYISHHDRRPLLIRPSYSIQVYCNSSTPCCTHTILRRKLYTLLGALVIGASRLSAFSESLALKSLWVNCNVAIVLAHELRLNRSQNLFKETLQWKLRISFQKHRCENLIRPRLGKNIGKCLLFHIKGPNKFEKAKQRSFLA